MPLISVLIIVIGLPFSILGFVLTRSYCRALSQQPKPLRYSHRARLVHEVPIL